MYRTLSYYIVEFISIFFFHWTHNHYVISFLSTKRWERSFTTNTSYGECQQNYEDTSNIGVKVFMRVTQRLLERNRDIFEAIMEFHSPFGYRLCGLAMPHDHRDLNVSRVNILRRIDETGHFSLNDNSYL
jgi:hypothetical protein